MPALLISPSLQEGESRGGWGEAVPNAALTCRHEGGWGVGPLGIKLSGSLLCTSNCTCTTATTRNPKLRWHASMKEGVSSNQTLFSEDRAGGLAWHALENYHVRQLGVAHLWRNASTFYCIHFVHIPIQALWAYLVHDMQTYAEQLCAKWWVDLNNPAWACTSMRPDTPSARLTFLPSETDKPFGIWDKRELDNDKDKDKDNDKPFGILHKQEYNSLYETHTPALQTLTVTCLGINDTISCM